MPAQVLVVDDDALCVNLVKDILSQENISVFCASSVSDALTFLGTSTPRLILSDFEMPEMNGMEFHAQVAKDGRWSKVPFMFMTGAVSPRLAEYAHTSNIRILKKEHLVQELLRLAQELKPT
jgi:CheY-like chemotaxis protein